MASQLYALGRQPRRRNYVDEINAKLDAGVLERQKGIEDTENYRANLLSLNNRALNNQRQADADRLRLEREKQDFAEKSATRSSLVGLGQMTATAKNARVKNEAIRGILEADGKAAAGTVAAENGIGLPSSYTPKVETPSFFSKEGLTSAGGWKQGLSNWGDIATGTLAGGAAGAQIGEKLGIGRVAGGGAASALLAGASTGWNPYTMAASFVGGSFLGSIM